MKIFKSFNILNKEINFNENIGFVPTMGSLHNGHLSLIKIAKKKSKKVLVSIFVNPSQFNDKKDFLKYPRNLRKDISILKKIGVNYLFLPNKDEIYKKGKKKKINIYKKENIESLNWIDITKNKNAELETKKTDKELLRRLHVEKDGQIYVGIDGFLLIWKNIPKYNVLYKFFKLPVIYQLFYVGYEIVAFFLYLKNRNQLN